MSARPHYDVALLQTWTAFKNYRYLSICNQEPQLGMLLGARGIGSFTSTNSYHSSRTQETFFYESVFESPSKDNFNSCRADNICVESLVSESNLCPSDVGDPLYTLTCGQRLKPCLYGVASYFVASDFETVNQKQHNDCRDIPVFAQVIPFRQWIIDTISSDPYPTRPS